MPESSFWIEQAEQLRLTERSVRQAYGEWIWSLAPWSIYTTLTFQDWQGQAPGIVKAREGLDALLDNNEANWRGFAFMLERGKLNGRLHWHGLIYSDRPILCPSWRGFLSWERVRSEGSAMYIAKYAVKTALDLRIKRPEEIAHPLTGMI